MSLPKPRTIFECESCGKRCTDVEAESRVFNTYKCACGGELRAAVVEVDGVTFYPLRPVPAARTPSAFEVTVEVECRYSSTAVFDAMAARQKQMLEAATLQQWTCVVCGLVHPIDHEGIWCGTCWGMACCSCERQMKDHKCG